MEKKLSSIAGTRVSPSTVSDLNQKIYETIEEWRNRPITGIFPYIFLDGIWLKRAWGGAERITADGLTLEGMWPSIIKIWTMIVPGVCVAKGCILVCRDGMLLNRGLAGIFLVLRR